MHRLCSTRSEASVRCGLQPWGTGEPRADSRGVDHKSGRVDACRVWGSAGSAEGLLATPPPPCGPAVLMPALRPLLPLLLLAGLTAGASLPPGPGGHPGVCPNQLSPNLWVDAQSTCERECVGDQVSTGSAPPARLWGRPAPGGPRVSWGSGWSAPEEPRSHP